jgi:hypothetical protein
MHLINTSFESMNFFLKKKDTYCNHVPPASNTRYLERGPNGRKPPLQPLIVFIGKYLQHKLAASGSRAISNCSLLMPA